MVKVRIPSFQGKQRGVHQRRPGPPEHPGPARNCVNEEHFCYANTNNTRTPTARTLSCEEGSFLLHPRESRSLHKPDRLGNRLKPASAVPQSGVLPPQTFFFFSRACKFLSLLLPVTSEHARQVFPYHSFFLFCRFVFHARV